CKRDGDTLTTPGAGDATAGWQKLTVYAAERTQHEGRPLYRELLRRLRAAGAGGATCLRGVWGFHGDHPPHGDRFWQLGRRVPVLTVIVDVPERMPEWFAIADELTSQTGLVTSEI